MFMRFCPIICIFFFVLIAKTHAQGSSSNELYNIMLNPPKDILQENSEYNSEKIVRGCISYKSEYNGLLSKNGLACMASDSKGRIVKTYIFSPLFTSSSDISEFGMTLIAGNAEIAPNYWELRDDRLCLINDSTSEATCLLANLEEDQSLNPLQSLKSDIKDHISSHCKEYLTDMIVFFMITFTVLYCNITCCWICNDLSHRRAFRER